MSLSQNPKIKPRMRILIVGCGGVGSEVAKLVRNEEITFVDFDRIELSNLNRQAYFTEADIGEYKAETISRKLNKKYMNKRIEEVTHEELDEYDAVFSCLDTVASRMELNLMFKRTKCDILIDCGVEGMKMHVKRVSQTDSCLYCIKYMYTTQKEIHLCSLRSVPKEITSANRERVLLSIIAKRLDSEVHKDKNSVCSIVKYFNSKAPEKLWTTEFEVHGLIHQVIPSICTTNSICAGYAVMMLYGVIAEDFLFYDTRFINSLSRVCISPDPDCLVCGSDRPKLFK